MRELEGPQHRLFVWSQPLDRHADDEMSVDGQVLAVGEHDARQHWMAVVDSVPRRRRRQLPFGGFIGRTRKYAVAELPIAEPRGGQSDTVVVALSRTQSWGEEETAHVMAEIERVASRGGFNTDSVVLRRALDQFVLSARPGCLSGWRS